MNNFIKSRAGFYLLPNLFTTAGLFAGFYAVIAALKGDFETAAISIFIAMVFDGVDGFIARLTNTTSAFGAGYDSLADMVSFGIAPALIVYSWALNALGKLGWVAAFIFTAAVALRLARFNTQTEQTDKRFFKGMPCTAGAGVLASTVWLVYRWGMTMTPSLRIIVTAITISIGLLMISEVRYHSIKQLDFRGRVPFILLIVIILLIAVTVLEPSMLLFIVFMGYACSGVVFTLIRQLRKRQMTKRLTIEKD